MGFWKYFTVVGKSVLGLQTGERPFKGSGIDNFGKVDSNLYRGSQPDKSDYAELKKRFGIKTIVDLRDDSKSWAKEEVEKAGLTYINIPLSDKDYPTEEQVTAIEKTLLSENLYPIFLNCAGARHRTGIAVGIYRVLKYNWGFNEIYREMKQYDFYTQFGHSEMKRFMKDYTEKR